MPSVFSGESKPQVVEDVKVQEAVPPAGVSGAGAPSLVPPCFSREPAKRCFRAMAANQGFFDPLRRQRLLPGFQGRDPQALCRHAFPANRHSLVRGRTRFCRFFRQSRSLSASRWLEALRGNWHTVSWSMRFRPAPRPTFQSFFRQPKLQKTRLRAFYDSARCHST